MVEIKDPEIVDREKEFIADEIFFINYVVSNYSNPIAPEPQDYAEIEFDKTTSSICSKFRAQLSVEATKKGLTGTEKGTYINLQVDKLKKERNNQKDEIVQKRTKELMTEIPEGLKNLKKLSLLETTVNDGLLIQDLAIKVLDVHPEDIDLLATEADAN